MTDLTLSADDVLRNLDSIGMSIEVAAAITGRSVSEIKGIIKQKRFIPEDAQIASAMRQLAWRVWAKSMEILEHGHPDQQAQIIRIVLSRTAGLIGEESDTSLEEQKQAINRILADQRSVDIITSAIESLPVPEKDNTYVKPPPSFSGTHDSGQEPENDEDPVRSSAEQDWR